MLRHDHWVDTEGKITHDMYSLHHWKHPHLAPRHKRIHVFQHIQSSPPAKDSKSATQPTPEKPLNKFRHEDNKCQGIIIIKQLGD